MAAAAILDFQFMWIWPFRRVESVVFVFCTKFCSNICYSKDKNSQKVDKILQKQAKDLKWKGINFPASWKDIDKIEKQKTTISVNVFGYKKVVYPLIISEYV